MEGTLTLYEHPLSPFAIVVAAVVDHLHITVDHWNMVDVTQEKNKPKDLKDSNPNGTIPTITDSKFGIGETLAI